MGGALQSGLGLVGFCDMILGKVQALVRFQGQILVRFCGQGLLGFCSLSLGKDQALV